MILELDNISVDWCNVQLTKLCMYLVAIACTKSHILYIDALLNFHEGEANLVPHFASVIFFWSGCSQSFTSALRRFFTFYKSLSQASFCWYSRCTKLVFCKGFALFSIRKKRSLFLFWSCIGFCLFCNNHSVI